MVELPDRDMNWKVGTLVFNQNTGKTGTVTHISPCEFGLWTVITCGTDRVASTMDGLMQNGWRIDWREILGEVRFILDDSSEPIHPAHD